MPRGGPGKPRRPRGEGVARRRADGYYERSLDLGKGPDGKRRVLWFRGKTKAEAAKRRKEAVEKLARGEVISSSQMTVEEWIRHWLSTTVATSVAEGQRKPMTEQSYRTLADEYVFTTVGHITLDTLTSADVNAMTKELHDSGYSANTRRLARALLRTALNDALAERLVARNVVETSVAPKVAGSTRTPIELSFKQARSLLASIADEPYGPLVEVALWTGLRKGELLALRWDAVDLDGAMLSVEATQGRVTGKGLVRSTPKTPKSKATVPLVPSAIAALRRQQAAQEKLAVELGERWKGSECVFHGPVGGPLDPSKATKRWNAIRDARGLPKATFQDLRHTTSTLLREANVALDVTSRILRHSSITMTADTYTKIGEPLMVEGLAEMEKRMKDEDEPEGNS